MQITIIAEKEFSTRGEVFSLSAKFNKSGFKLSIGGIPFSLGWNGKWVYPKSPKSISPKIDN